MPLLSRWAVLFIGIVFHLTFMMSIFDIYFVSPLVHGVKHYHPETVKPAKRLFLIVGDGLRADKCFEQVIHPSSGEEEYLAPFIRSKALTAGTFGLSHTRVPTESRPGHVAMIAGFYEDVSAVTKGWQENPVDFDSVFNQSRHTFSFGSPDILPMFSKGAVPGRVDMEVYDHSYEDFTRSSIDLDKFVFDHLDKLFAEAKVNSTLADSLHHDQQVFFLHLLGIDTAGHSYRPYSAEYYDNIKYIDVKISELETKVNAFYGDDETAWVFTADHGMSAFGSHGDGHPNNTRTPLVVWGKGVNTPLPGTEGHDEESLLWDLPVQRHDVNQADIATLMSYLIGVNYPANSVGELPLDFIDAKPESKARALAENAYSIVEQYLVKEKQLKANYLYFKPYPELSGENNVDNLKAQIEDLITQGHYEQAILRAEDFMSRGLSGLRYLQTYNWLLLRSLVTLGFLGWMLFAFISFLHLFVVEETPVQSTATWPSAVAVAIFGALAALFYRQHSPLNYYLYALFPVFFWYQVVSNKNTLLQGIKLLFLRQGTGLGGCILATVFGFIIIEAMIYGYFHREVFSVLMLAIYMWWPWLQDWKLAVANWRFSVLWSSMCVVLAAFTISPVVKIENLDMIVQSGVLMSVISFVAITALMRSLKLTGITMVTCGVQLGLIVLAVIVTRSSVLSLQARKGLPIGSQIVGWMTLFSSLTAPFMNSLSPVNDFRFRFLTVFMAFCPTFVILSISYEGYFYVAFSLLLYSWVELERRVGFEGEPGRPLRLGDFRMAVRFMFLTHIAFFGTGNIASISSFSLDSVYRLIPIFSPFAMGALLIVKILVPFLLLSVTLGIINLAVGLEPYAIFSMVLSITDILSLNFFYLVVDEGSWLDIGTGISHFCICSAMCLFILFLEYVSTMLVSGVEIAPVSVKVKELTPATDGKQDDTATE
ncbi:GPI ethanolamine phosphate transferase 1 [Wickerhamiella sorbophila]|uniref:GPI ethanolamine phosphate transferase 1 n=1 Tax=Wickerhamiella sorbophila TaxID=45607 RepID=A0A2T0FN86_9ASCO|nr:GPI ethanolamine phosphate transferase 1 [Wickerhamiella sorbophila]PRT56437.1 GPI ethanolamine phosphate transferase 1 [Wickerhamiella sorbophila]